MGQKPFDPEDVKGSATIKSMRRALGMPEIKSKSKLCDKCKKTFTTTFKYERAQQRYCSLCRHALADDDTPFRI